MITRRKIVLALGAGAFAPLALFAQQKIWRVGFLAQQHVDFVDSNYVFGPFTQGMRELGYVVGKNLVIEWRSAEGNTERLPELAAELVRLKVDVLVTTGTPASLAAQKATTAIPIVMIGMGDPVGSGLVKSLARPGGNSTGFSIMSADLVPKLLEMLRGIVPKVTRVAVLVNPSNASNTLGLKNVQAAAPKVGVTILPVEASTPQEIANGFAVMTRQKAGALIVLLEPFFQQQKNQIVELAAKQRLPSIGQYGEYVEAGGLMSYGQNIRENPRRAATYVDTHQSAGVKGQQQHCSQDELRVSTGLHHLHVLQVRSPRPFSRAVGCESNRTRHPSGSSFSRYAASALAASAAPEKRWCQTTSNEFNYKLNGCLGADASPWVARGLGDSVPCS